MKNPMEALDDLYNLLKVNDRFLTKELCNTYLADIKIIYRTLRKLEYMEKHDLTVKQYDRKVKKFWKEVKK